jgi:hypothetical protein
LFLVNAEGGGRDFRVPAAFPRAPWSCRFDTARGVDEIRALDFADHYPLAAGSAVLLEC